MKKITLPKKLNTEELERGTRSIITIEPCFPGYGLTLGNALRRVLLSSLPGGAVTAVKIDGVQHEFSTIDSVTEDVVDVIINLKKLRVKMHTDEPVTLKLKSKNEGPVTAGDIEENSDVEIINKDLVIATLNNKKSELNMELTVSKGIGYVPSEDQVNEKSDIGVILVDSIFTPVVNVGLKVEDTRVGKETNYDKVILDVETDGTITPEQAVLKASEILNNQFAWIMDGGKNDIEEVDTEAEVEAEIKTKEGEEEIEEKNDDIEKEENKEDKE